MSIIFWIYRPLLFILGFFLLIWGGNLLVNGAVDLAKRLKVSSLLIGLTVVGCGTSTPELMASLLAVTGHVDGLAAGNVIGSNIANILLVLGIAAFIHPIHISKISIRRDSKFLLLSTFILSGIIIFGRITALLGIFMCACLGYYIYYAYQTDKRHQRLVEEMNQGIPPVSRKKKPLWPFVLRTIIGIGLTIFGAKILVDNAVMLAEHMNVSEAVIGLTLIAVGTSLPELVTSIIASLKKQSDVVFGNIVGSNIYNALFILGLTAVFMPIDVSTTLFSNVIWMMGATVLLLVLSYMRHQISRTAGITFVVLYALYISSLGL